MRNHVLKYLFLLFTIVYSQCSYSQCIIRLPDMRTHLFDEYKHIIYCNYLLKDTLSQSLQQFLYIQSNIAKDSLLIKKLYKIKIPKDKNSFLVEFRIDEFNSEINSLCNYLSIQLKSSSVINQNRDTISIRKGFSQSADDCQKYDGVYSFSLISTAINSFTSFDSVYGNIEYELNWRDSIEYIKLNKDDCIDKYIFDSNYRIAKIFKHHLFLEKTKKIDEYNIEIQNKDVIEIYPIIRNKDVLLRNNDMILNYSYWLDKRGTEVSKKYFDYIYTIRKITKKQFLTKFPQEQRLLNKTRDLYYSYFSQLPIKKDFIIIRRMNKSKMAINQQVNHE